MQHNIVRKHRRTVSSINMGQNIQPESKTTMSTYEDTEGPIITEIPKEVQGIDKGRHRLRHRAISDLIEACNKVSDSKSVMVEELNVSINYKDSVFQFGKDKKLKELHQKKNMFKKSTTKQLDAIVEKNNLPKSSRLFLRKKVTGIESQKISLFSKKQTTSSLVNSLNKSIHGPTAITQSKPIPKMPEKEEKKDPVSVKKQIRKIEVKKNFKF